MTATENSLALLGALVLEDGQRWGEVCESFQIEDAEAILSGDGPRFHFFDPRAWDVQDDGPGRDCPGLGCHHG